jgi:hypothetical protein
MQLDLLLAHAGVESLELGFRGVESGTGLIEILLADHACLEEATAAIVLLLSPFQVSFRGGASIFLAFYGGLLLERIDLHHELARRDDLAGVHGDLDDLTLHLGHDDGRVAGLQGGDVIGGIADGNGLGDLDFHGERTGRTRIRSGALAAAWREKSGGEGGCQEDARSIRRRLRHEALSRSPSKLTRRSRVVSRQSLGSKKNISQKGRLELTPAGRRRVR